MFGVCFSIPAHYRRIGLKFLHITHTQHTGQTQDSELSIEGEIVYQGKTSWSLYDKMYFFVYLVNVVAGRVNLLGDQAHHHLVLDAVVGEGVDLPPARGLDLAGDVEVLEDDVPPLVLATPPL